MSDHLRRYEWRCSNCGSINAEDEEFCWSCEADQDGFKHCGDCGYPIAASGECSCQPPFTPGEEDFQTDD